MCVFMCARVSVCASVDVQKIYNSDLAMCEPDICANGAESFGIIIYVFTRACYNALAIPTQDLYVYSHVL